MTVQVRHPLDCGYSELDVAQLRNLYTGIWTRALTRMSADDFMGQVTKFLVEHGTTQVEATPVDWVKAAARVRHHCSKCNGSGVYCWRTHQGSHQGECYRCEGKGSQHDGDRRRNWGYDHLDFRRDVA